MESKLRNQEALLEMAFTLLISSPRQADTQTTMELELLRSKILKHFESKS